VNPEAAEISSGQGPGLAEFFRERRRMAVNLLLYLTTKKLISAFTVFLKNFFWRGANAR